MTNHDPALLAGRILASAIFVLSGWGKLMGMAGTVGYFEKVGVPAPMVAYYVAVTVELGGGLLMLVGLQTRLVALVLAVFCVATAVLGHSDFSNPQQMTNFMKNLSMCGGFLAFVAAGGGLFSVDGMMQRNRVAV